MSDNLVLIGGKSATGKSLSLMFLENQERCVYLRCEGKKLPFKHNFKEIVVTDPYQVHAAFDQLSEKESEFDTVIIDSMTFLADMAEAKLITRVENKQAGWGHFQTFFKDLFLEKIAETKMNVVIIAHTLDQYSKDEMAMETLVPIKGGLKNNGMESYFSNVVASKKIQLTDLEKYSSELLTITEEDELLGYKYCFQTRLTKETVGERLRSPLGMWTIPETFIDNNCQSVIKRLHEYYDD